VKQAWQRSKLSVRWWHGAPPVPGDELHTKTGRRYLIVRVLPKALDCLVLPADEPVTAGSVFLWEWAPRSRRRAV